MKTALTLLLVIPPLVAQAAADPAAPVRFVDVTDDGLADRLHLSPEGLSVSVNRGGGAFDAIRQTLPAVEVSDVLASDLDGDGLVDLYLVSPGPNVALLGDGTGRFTDATERLGLADTGLGLSAERLDLDRAAPNELLLHNVTGDVLFWARPDGTFERDGTVASSPPAGGGESAGPAGGKSKSGAPRTSGDEEGGSEAGSSSSGGGIGPVASPPPSLPPSLAPSTTTLVPGPTPGSGLRVSGGAADSANRGPAPPTGTQAASATDPDVLYVNDDAGEVGPADIVDGSLTGGDISTKSGDATLNGNLDVAGTIETNALVVTGNTTLLDSLLVDGGAIVYGTIYPNGLDVNGLIQTNDLLQVNATGRGLLHKGGTIELGSYVSTASGSGQLGTFTAHPLHFFTNNSAAKAALTVVGDFGIGTTSPQAKLEVRGSGSFLGNHLALFNNTGVSSGDGIAIKLNAPIPRSHNKFVTFLSANNSVVGAIEGQSLSELHESFEFIWQESMSALDLAFVVAEGIACGFQFDLGEVGVMATEGGLAAAKWIEMTYSWEHSHGVSYSSGSADYAEWLPKADPRESFSFGDVVGVRAGRISKATAGADHLMVVSRSPIVLGNAPPDGQHEGLEMVAFMGQVPVKVTGAVRSGDYLLPSSRDDGLAIAVRPEQMTLADHRGIVGVAWEASAGDGLLTYVNTAVGLNSSALVTRMIRQQDEIDSLRDGLAAIVEFLQTKDPGALAALQSFAPPASPADPLEAFEASAKMSFSDRRAQMIAVLRASPESTAAIQADARELLTARGIDFNLFEQTRRLLNDPAYLVEMFEGQTGR